uniref:PH domain-containing protein n=1 Tax=Oncorhynchus tshawytscha TaxID=74940 RepID=A0A8C8IC51_ONCTS
MSGQKSANPCNKFQANIFYKSKCQNCFKSRELHLPTDHGKDQAKPIYGGWLCLAAEGTDFDNQFRGQGHYCNIIHNNCISKCFALDELTSTLPQGTVNMNLCTAVIDAEPKTGQRNALCIITPEQEFFIRGENKEIINGWSEQLVVYPRTYKQNQKKKRKVEPTTSQVITSSFHNIVTEMPGHRWLNTCLKILRKIRQLLYMSMMCYAFTHYDNENILCSSGWRKYWFVLSADSLRYYKDSFAEENSDLEGEIDLTKCHNVSEHQVQRNYGFQIHTQKCVFTLSAMTAGIRRNWIQALMKNVHPSNAPDVARSLPLFRQNASFPPVQGPKQSRIRERRREGRSKTFDWAEFSPMALLAPEQEVQQETKEPLRMEVGDLERKRRREERRRRYDSMLGFLVGWEMDCDRGGISPRSPRTHQRVQREIEQCWQQVERTAFRQEKTVPLYTESQGKDKEDMGILLETYHRRVSLSDLPSLKSLTDMYRETRELLQQQELKKQDIQEQLQKQLGLALPLRLCLPLQATYEHGFVTMEESQQRIVGELQHRHQQDLQRLQLDTDRLLEEETAATITAIEAMKNAHRAEVKREIQRACHENNNAGDVNLGEICSEELVSCHRELEVLSQQYSLKCLESSHLGQALEAERQALCQCQQENQDLRTRNQELSGHLAAEITRLCSLAKQDAFPLSQERDVYELEISLRVKESEVQCLKQKITSLKDELQTAHRDKRYVTETYKDIYTELSIMRAKAERDLGHLRENLRLAHKALGELSPAVDTDNNGIHDIKLVALPSGIQR